MYTHAVVAQAAMNLKRKRRLTRTGLTSDEMINARTIWQQHVGDGFVTNFQTVLELMASLQIPMQDAIQTTCHDRFRELKGRISFQDFVTLLEQCKTIHIKWLSTIRGKQLDDDLLEAFVAVGGGEDTHGSVDVAKMKGLIDDFHLDIDLDKIIAEMDQDGSADIDFSEFSELLREGAPKGIKPLLSSQIHLKRQDIDPEEEEDEEGQHGSPLPTVLKPGNINRQNSVRRISNLDSSSHSMASMKKRKSTVRPGHLPPLGNTQKR
jgi:Ca2+-binding EF-hand superfamily protein